MDRLLKQISISLAVLGLLISIYMTIFKLTENESMCLGNGGCSVVNNSIYSQVSGIPVAVLGIFGYAAILGTLVLSNSFGFFQRFSVTMTFGMALAGFLFTLYLIYVEFELIHALCPFCITSQVGMILLFIVSVIRLAREPAN